MILRLAYQENDPVENSYWNDMRNHDYSKSFAAVKGFIHQNSPQMRSPNKRRNHITWLFAVLLPMLIFFSCKQNIHIEPQGATLSFIAKDSVQSTVEFAIQQFADNTWKVVMRSHAGIIHGTIYTSDKSSVKLKAFIEKLKTTTGVMELHYSAASTAVKESRLSQLSYKIFNQHIDAKSTSNKQLCTEIETKIKATGLHNLKVQLVEENGKKLVKFVSTGKNQDFSINLTLRDGTNVIAIGWFNQELVAVKWSEQYIFSLV